MIHSWDEKGYDTVLVSVNISRAGIYQSNLADILMDLVHRYELHPSRLHLEIIESAYTENPEQIISTVKRLRDLGFMVEMDDFGSGYSSLNMLNEMPIDVLKLDMKFIQNETAKPVNQGILQFIMNLARWMGLRVIAEGVEKKEQLDRLREIGCDYVQGYYFAKPMPCNDIELIVKKGNGKQELGEQGPVEEMSSLPILLIVDKDVHYQDIIKKRFLNSIKFWWLEMKTRR